MQSTTAEGEPLSDGFADEVLSPDRTHVARLRIGWGGDTDFSGQYAEVPCESFSIDRQLTGDLPDVTEAIEGFSSAAMAAALLPLSVEGERRAVWWYSRYNTASPLYGLERLGAEVTADVGLVTDAGLEHIRKYTGNLRGLPVKSTSATASMSSLDYREKLRARVRLPMVVAAAYDEELQPGLSVNWILNEVLQANGVYAIPPNHEQCVFSASFLGSTWPSVGKLASSYYQDTVKRPLTFETDGPFGPALDARSEVRDLAYLIDDTYPIGPQPGQAFLAQGWVHAGEDTGTSPDVTFVFSLRPEPNSLPGSAILNILNGQLFVSGTRAPGELYALSGPAFTGDPAWHYVGVHVKYTDNDVVGTFNLDGAVSADSYVTPVGLDYGPNWGRAAFDAAPTPIVANVPKSAWQIAAMADPPAEWDDAFEPTAVIERSANEIVAITPADDQDSWDLIKDLSSTEFAAFFFDERGIFRWWPTSHWEQPETLTVVREVTAENSLVDLAYDDRIDQIRNVVRVSANPITIGAAGFIWESAEVYEIPAQSTVEIWANFEYPVWQLATDNPARGPVADRSYVQAWDADDDTGAEEFDHLIDITAFAQAAKITVTNLKTYPIWIHGEIDGTDRPPGIKLFGKAVMTATNSTVTAEQRAQYSIDQFGEQAIDIPVTRWRQTLTAVQRQAAYLGAQLSGPRPVLTDIPIVGDPRLQLGDRIRIVDAHGMALDGTYRITGIRDDYTPAGFMQTLTARLSPTPAEWDISTWDGGDSWT